MSGEFDQQTLTIPSSPPLPLLVPHSASSDPYWLAWCGGEKMHNRGLSLFWGGGRCQELGCMAVGLHASIQQGTMRLNKLQLPSTQQPGISQASSFTTCNKQAKVVSWAARNKTLCALPPPSLPAKQAGVSMSGTSSQHVWNCAGQGYSRIASPRHDH